MLIGQPVVAQVLEAKEAHLEIAIRNAQATAAAETQNAIQVEASAQLMSLLSRRSRLPQPFEDIALRGVDVIYRFTDTLPVAGRVSQGGAQLLYLLS
jgi:hypothetical protein